MTDLKHNPTLAELVADDSRAAAVLERHRLDFCCGGKQTLADACAKRGIDPETVEAALQEALADGPADPDDLAALPLPELLELIVTKHHEYLRQALPSIDKHLSKVAKVHGPKHPYLLEVQTTFDGLREELEAHLEKEEQVLFPYIQAMASAASSAELPHACFGSVQSPIQMMELEHDNAGNALAKLHELTNSYTPPEGACGTFCLTYQQLAELEEDLHLHIHKENYVLHPRAIKLEAKLTNA